MSSLATNPLVIHVLHPHSKSPVWAIKCRAVVYRDERGNYYVRPQTAENIRIKVHVNFHESRFECRLHARNFLLAFFPEEVKQYNG